MITPPLTLINGQLATAAGTIFDPNTLLGSTTIVPLGPLYVDLRLANTSASVTQTITITLKLGSTGLTTRVGRFVMPANYTGVITGIAVQPGDLLIGVTTTASVADYTITQSVPGSTATMQMFDNTGQLANTTGTTLSGNIATTGSVLSSSPTGGVGYSTGAGGAVTQLTGRTTGVTLNTATGAITLFSAAGSATPATFTVTNSAVAALDTVVVSQKSGTDAYSATVSAVAAGSFKITITDLTGTTTEAPVFNFCVVKGVAS